MQAENPDRNVAFTAIEQLKNEDQIREFFKQYVELLRDSGKENPEALARESISFITGRYYGRETLDRWMKALPDREEEK